MASARDWANNANLIMSHQKKSKTNLLADSSDDDTPAPELRINRKYATQYEQFKRRQELERARDLGLIDENGNPINDDDDSTSESEDEGDALTPFMDLQVMKTIQMIRNKDPRIYDSSYNFFKDTDHVSTRLESQPKELVAREKKPKKKIAKDILRDQLIAAAEEGKADAFDSDNDMPTHKGLISGQSEQISDSVQAKVYDAEQAKLRDAFRQAVNSESEAEESDDGLLKVVKRSQEEVDAARASYREFLEKEKGKLPLPQDETKAIDDYLKTEANDEAENFLREFTLNKAWQADVVEANPDLIFADIADEVAVENANAFESAYNFRFEEEGGGQIKTHARTIEDSMRRKDDKRKRQREARKERQQQEKAEREAELRRLTNMKRAEQRTRLQAVQTVAGAELDLNKIDLDGDFDPEQYDKLMQQLFSDDYYEAPEHDKGMGNWHDGAEDSKQPAWMQATADEIEAGVEDTAVPAHMRTDSDAEGDVAAEAAGETATAESSKKKGKAGRASAAAPASTAAGAVLPGGSGARLEDDDEVLALHYEDVVGGVKTRFKYRSVPSNSWGLKTEDILAADDQDLNEFVSLKKLAPYREVEWRVPSNKRSRDLNKLRKKVYASIPEEDPETTRLHAAAQRKEAKQARKANKRKRRQEEDEAVEAELAAEGADDDSGKRQKQEKADMGEAGAGGKVGAVEEGKAESESKSKDKGKTRRRQKKGRGGAGEDGAKPKSQRKRVLEIGKGRTITQSRMSSYNVT